MQLEERHKKLCKLQCSAWAAHVRLDVDTGSSSVCAAGAGADDAGVVVDSHCQALCTGLSMQTWMSCLAGGMGVTASVN